MACWRRTEIDDDANVGRDGARRCREHRVQVHLGDLGKIADQRRDVDDHVGERVAIDRLRAAHAFQDFCGGDTVEHRQRVVAGCGREAEGDVLQHFDQHAAQTERHKLAERRVGHRADDHLLAAGEHLLHLDALDARFRVVLFRVRDDRVVTLFDFIGAVHADQHAAGFGLVQNFR